MARDALGQTLATAIADMKGGDDKNFSIDLKEPFPLLIDGLAKVSSLAPFIMPERLAKTDPYQQVTEMVGSGPFKFVKEEHQPGNIVVYVKNTDYVPRSEPPDWASGGKVVKVDRVEWVVVPDIATKAAAMQNGEDDWWENPPADLWPVLAANSDMELEPRIATRRHGLFALQFALSAVRQRQDAPGSADGGEPTRLHDRLCRRPEELEGLRLLLHLRGRRWRATSDRRR